MALSAVVLLAGVLSPAGADPLHDSLQKLRAKINAAKQSKTPAKNPNPKSTPAVHPHPRRTASLPVHVPRFPEGGAVPPPKSGAPIKLPQHGYSVSYETERPGKMPTLGDVRVVTDSAMYVTINLKQATPGKAEALDLPTDRKAMVQVRPMSHPAPWQSIFVRVRPGAVAVVHVKAPKKQSASRPKG